MSQCALGLFFLIPDSRPDSRQKKNIFCEMAENIRYYYTTIIYVKLHVNVTCNTVTCLCFSLSASVPPHKLAPPSPFLPSASSQVQEQTRTTCQRKESEPTSA